MPKHIGESAACFFVPGSGVRKTVLAEQITSPQCYEAVECHQRRRRAQDGLVVPLSLRFHTKMRTGLGKSDLDLPATNVEGNDVEFRLILIYFFISD